MKERGITRPAPKAAIAAAVALAGGGAALWGALDPAAPGTARPLGVVALIVGSLAAMNYFYALTLVRRMQRGEGVIGRWTVAPALFDRVRAAERNRTRRKNNWRLPRAAPPDGLPVIFTKEAVLVGDTYFRLASTGMSRFMHVRIDADPFACIEFSMRLTVIGAGTQGRTARYRGHLRIPIAQGADAEAARVVAYFKSLVG